MPMNVLTFLFLTSICILHVMNGITKNPIMGMYNLAGVRVTRTCVSYRHKSFGGSQGGLNWLRLPFSKYHIA
jgi:hypothetical protein